MSDTENTLQSKYHDPLLAPAEEAVKAESEQASRAELARRAEAAAAYEESAPLATRTAALPERLATLKYLAPEDQELYARDVDGSFVLTYVRIHDEASLKAHAERVGRSLHVLNADETPHTHAARAKRAQEMESEVWKILDAEEKAKREAQMAKFDAEEQKRRAEYDRQREEYLRSATNMRAAVQQ